MRRLLEVAKLAREIMRAVARSVSNTEKSKAKVKLSCFSTGTRSSPRAFISKHLHFEGNADSRPRLRPDSQ